MSGSGGIYTPRYGNIESVPLIGPDPFDPDTKLWALQRAETKLESDLTGGGRIDDPDDRHALAVGFYATYLLSLAPHSPNATGESGRTQRISARDFADDGSQRRFDFSEKLKDEYEDLVSEIQDTDDDGDGEPDGMRSRNFGTWVA